SGAQRGCQDNIFVGTLAEANNRWTLPAQFSFGSGDANEVAFAIKPIGGGRYLLAGYGVDAPTGALAAKAYRVKIAPSQVEEELSKPYPENGSDKDGNDRYYVIIPMPAGRFLLGGWASASKQSPRRAVWQWVSADLRNNGPLNGFKGRE